MRRFLRILVAAQPARRANPLVARGESPGAHLRDEPPSTRKSPLTPNPSPAERGEMRTARTPRSQGRKPRRASTRRSSIDAQKPPHPRPLSSGEGRNARRANPSVARGESPGAHLRDEPPSTRKLTRRHEGTKAQRAKARKANSHCVRDRKRITLRLPVLFLAVRLRAFAPSCQMVRANTRSCRAFLPSPLELCITHNFFARERSRVQGWEKGRKCGQSWTILT